VKKSWVKLRIGEGLNGFWRGEYWLSAAKGSIKVRYGLGCVLIQGQFQVLVNRIWKWDLYSWLYSLCSLSCNNTAQDHANTSVGVGNLSWIWAQCCDEELGLSCGPNGGNPSGDCIRNVMSSIWFWINFERQLTRQAFRQWWILFLFSSPSPYGRFQQKVNSLCELNSLEDLRACGSAAAFPSVPDSCVTKRSWTVWKCCCFELLQTVNRFTWEIKWV